MVVEDPCDRRAGELSAVGAERAERPGRALGLTVRDVRVLRNESLQRGLSGERELEDDLLPGIGSAAPLPVGAATSRIPKKFSGRPVVSMRRASFSINGRSRAAAPG